MGGSPGLLRLDDQDDLIAACRADMPAMCAHLLGYEGTTALAPHQVEWQEHVQDAILQAFSGDPLSRHLCILGPSEHGKTYGIDLPAIVWVLGRLWRGMKGQPGFIHGRNLRIGVLGATEEKAVAVGTIIDRLFKTRGEELELLGLRPGYPWNSQQKYLERDDQKDLAASITCFGPESEIQGERYDLLVMEDFFTVRNQRSAESRRKCLDFLEQSVYNRMEERGVIIASGHSVHPEDCYRMLEQDEENWRVLRYRAIVKEPSGAEPAVVLWPAKWPYQKLDRIRRQRPGVFQLMYQNAEQRAITSLERAAFDACLDRPRTLVNYLEPELRGQYQAVIGMLDPAFSQTRQGAYSVCYMVGVKPDECWEVLGGWRLKLLPLQLRDKVVSTVLSFMPDRFYVEANAQQVLLSAAIKEKLGVHAERIEPVWTNDKDGEGPDVLLGRVVDKFLHGSLRLPYLGQPARELAEQTFSEIASWPIRPNDCVMSLVVGYKGRLGLSSKHAFGTTMRTSLFEAVAARVHPQRAADRGTFQSSLMGYWQAREGAPKWH